MPKIFVKGIGELEFDDSMSEVDIEKAIKEHPEYAQAQKNASSDKFTPKWVRDYLGPAEDVPSGKTFVREAGKGVPIARHYIPEDQDMARMEKEWPWTTKGARITGAVGATLPLAGGVGALTGTALLPAIAGQSTLGAGLAGADTLAEKGKDTTGKDIWDSAKIGALWGGAGPLVGKALSPGTYVAPPKPMPFKAPEPTLVNPLEGVKPNYKNIRATARQKAGLDVDMTNAERLQRVADRLMAERHTANQVAEAQAAAEAAQAAKAQAQAATEARLEALRAGRTNQSSHNDSIKEILMRMGGGAVAGHFMNPSSPLMATAMATAGAVAPHLPAIGAKLWHNNVMQQPGTRDILNALMTSQGVGQ